MENKRYYIIDLEKEVNEDELKQLLFKEELGDISNNLENYYNGYYDLSKQFELIYKIKNDNVENVINTLEGSWNYSIYDNTCKHFETTFMFQPNTSIEHIENTINHIENLVDRYIGTDRKGLIDIPYKIKGFSKGYQVIIEHQSPYYKINDIERELKQDAFILNYISVEMD